MAWRKNWMACLLAASSVMTLGRLASAGDINVTYSESQGNTSTYTYDSHSSASQSSSGNVTTYTYDSNTTNTYGSGPPTTYTYDALGKAQADSSSGPTTYTYDDIDSGHAGDIDDQNTSGSYTEFPQGGTTRYTYDYNGSDPTNEQVTETDPQGRVTQYQYDAVNGVTSADTDGQGNTTRYEYDAQDRTIQNIDDTTTSSTNAYDDIGKTIEFTDGLSIPTQYDFEGGIIIQSGDVQIQGLHITLYDDSYSTPKSLFDFTFPTFTPPGSIPGMSPTSSQGSLQGWLTPGDNYTFMYSYDVLPGAGGQYGTVQTRFNLNLAVPLPSAWAGSLLLLAGIGLRKCRRPVA